MPNNVFPYPGNKARHSDWILEHIPEHECYVELFGGAAGVLFNKPRSKIEVYNDLNGDIPHFFEVLRDRCDELQEWLRNAPYSRELYDEWADEYYDGSRPDDDIERAGRFVYLRYTSFGGKIETKSGFCSSFGCRSHASDYFSKVDQLDEFAERLRGVEIDCADAFEVIERHDKPGTVFYADPPYVGTEGRYNSEGFDHQRLSEVAESMEGKIVISYDSVPHFYGDGFTVTSKESSFGMDSNGTHKDATEFLIMNFDSRGEPLMSDVGQQGLDAFAD